MLRPPPPLPGSLDPLANCTNLKELVCAQCNFTGTSSLSSVPFKTTAIEVVVETTNAN